MKTTVPDALKSDLPPNKWGKLLAATPVVMTVLATMLAGLASSEMTRAQYDRSLAAQQQSKAGDQWNLFQAKKLRGTLQRTTLDLLDSATAVRPLDVNALTRTLAQTPAATALSSAAGQQALTELQTGELPSSLVTAPTVDANVQAALAALIAARPDADVLAMLGMVSEPTLAEALQQAEDAARSFDAATAPVNKAIELVEKLLTSEKSVRLASDAAMSALGRDFTAARLRATAVRYDAEARLNQTIANLRELQVRKSNTSAERHHHRSQRFFFGMLAAQMGVIIATFAMAAKQRNLLWSLAAGAGVIAATFAVYVYFYL